MKIFYLSLIFISILLLPIKIFSQSKVIDSLKNELKKHPQKDTTRVNIFDRLSYLYYRKDLNKAKEYINKAEALSQEIGFEKGKANTLYMRGIVELMQANYDQSITYFEQASHIYSDNGFKKSLADCYNGIGVVYLRQSDYPKALLNFEKALKSDEEAGVKKNIPNYLINMGNIYARTGKYPEAIANYKRSLDIYKEAKNTLGIAACLKNISTIYDKQGNYPLALKYANKGLTLAEELQDSVGVFNSLNNISLIYKNQNKYDKALQMLEKALTFHQSRNNLARVAGVKNNIASLYMKKQDYDAAIQFLKESIELNRNTNSKSQLTDALNNLGFSYLSLQKYEAAEKCFEEAKQINLTINDQESLSNSYLGLASSYVKQKEYSKALPIALSSLEISHRLKLLDYQKEVYKLLSEIYTNKKDYKKALDNFKQYKSLNDSLFNKESIEKITQLEYEYQYKQAIESANLRELKLKKTVQTTTKDLQKSQRNYLLAIIGVLLVSILLGAMIFYQKLKNEKSKTQHVVMEQKLLRSQMTPHFIFNSLSVLQGMILNKEEKKSVNYLSKFSRLLRLTLENSRDKLVLLTQELAAVTDYLTLHNLESDNFKYTVEVDKTIDTGVFQIPPMLIQPFVENALEHAFLPEATDKNIAVTLKYTNQQLICTIADNGVGINTKTAKQNTQKNSLATTITAERLEVLSKDLKMEGSVTIEDRSIYNDQGTLVTLVIPHQKIA